MPEQHYGPILPIAEETHIRKHRLAGESFREAMSRISNVLSDNPEHFESYRQILLNQRFLPGGRIQAAVGSPRKTTAFNCYVSGTIEDSMDGIMDKAKEAAKTMRLGGGIGYDFSTLRPKGDLIVSLDSKSSGPLSFMAIFDAICTTVSSAGMRRGAQMGVLRIDHPDIEDFIEAKTNSTKYSQFNLSVGVTDAFMEAVETDSEFNLHYKGRVYKRVSARYLWEKLMRATWDWAEPGILFIDRINNENNLWYCETIAATNPCLHPDSLVETVEGRVRIADITEPTLVYTVQDDGSLGISKASASWVSKQNTKTLKLKVGSGKELICTPDHKILVTNYGWKEAKDIVIGDQLVHLCRARRGAAYSGVKLSTEDNRAYKMEHRMIAEAVYGELNVDDNVHHIDGNTYNNSIDNLEVLTHSAHSRHTALNDNPQTHQVIGSLGRFISTGKSQKRIIPMPIEMKSNLKNGNSACVISIEEGPITNVYDLSVEGTHNFIADFIVVHNCGEQPLPPYGACLLGSFNLVKYILEYQPGHYRFNWELFKEDIPVVVRAQDNVIDNTVFPLEEQKQEAFNKRRMGLGYTGLANAGEVLGYTYGSPEFLKFQEKLSRILANEAYAASALLAKEKGVFPKYDSEKYLSGKFIQRLDKDVLDLIQECGIRNSHLLSIAPTGTISLTADNVSSGCEPVFSYYYDRTILTDGGEKKVERISDYGYRVWGVKGKTAAECTPEDHLAVLIIATKWVDSAVSKTLNVGENVSWEEFKDIYMKAWKAGCKGATTFRAAGKRYGVLNTIETPEDVTTACYYDLDTGQKSCS